jgi:hypothetical protein
MTSRLFFGLWLIRLMGERGSPCLLSPIALDYHIQTR